MSELIDIQLRDGAIVRAKVAGDGPPLILYGNMVSWPFWCYQIPVLAQHYRVIAPEYRDDPIPGQSALDTLAADVPDLIRSLGYEQAFLVGHSIGSMVLAKVLEQHPEVATAVVLGNGFLRMPLLPRALHRLQPGLVPLISTIYPRLPWIARQIGSYLLLWWDQHIFLYGESDQEKRHMFFGYTFTSDPSMVLRLAAALEYHEPPDLHRAHVPVLVISSGKDHWVRLSDARRLVELLPCGEHLLIPSIGHMSPLVVPDVFNRAVLDFFGRVRPGVL